MSDTPPCAWSAKAAADRIAESLANESNLVLSDRDTAILRRHLRAFAEANRPASPPGSVGAVARPDFGEDRQEFHGTVLTCKRIAPGLTLHDLIMAFDRGESEAETGDDAAGNPSRWPVTRGVKAVTNTILDAVYGPEGRALAALPPTTLANIPPTQRAALRLAIDYALDDVRPTDLVRGDVRDALRAVLARLEAI